MAKNLSNNTLISSELSRLGRNMAEIVQLIDELVKKGVRVILLKQSFDSGNDGKLKIADKITLGVYSALAEAERELISERTEEGLMLAREKGSIGGRRKGTLYNSIYDKHLPQIKEYLKQNIPLSTVVKLIKEGKPNSLAEYLSKRGFRTKSLMGQAVNNLKRKR